MRYNIDVYEDKWHTMSNLDAEPPIYAIISHYDERTSELFKYPVEYTVYDGVFNLSDTNAVDFHKKLRNGVNAFLVHCSHNDTFRNFVEDELSLIAMYTIEEKETRYSVIDYMLGSHGKKFYESVEVAGVI